MSSPKSIAEKLIGWNKACLAIAKNAMASGLIPPSEETSFMNFISDVYTRLRQAAWLFREVKDENRNREKILLIVNNILKDLCLLDVGNTEELKSIYERTDTLVSKLKEIPNVKIAFEQESQKQEDGFLMSTDEIIQVFPLFRPMDSLNQAVLSGETFPREIRTLLYSFSDDELDIASERSESGDDNSTLIVKSQSSDENLSLHQKPYDKNELADNGTGKQINPTLHMEIDPERPKESEGLTTIITPVPLSPQQVPFKDGKKGKKGSESQKNVLLLKAQMERIQESYNQQLKEAAQKLKDMEAKVMKDKQVDAELLKMRSELEKEQGRIKQMEEKQKDSTKSSPLSVPTMNKRLKTGFQQDKEKGESSTGKLSTGMKRKIKTSIANELEEMIDVEDVDFFLDTSTVFGPAKDLNKSLADTFFGVNDALHNHFSNASKNKISANIIGPSSLTSTMQSGSINLGAGTSSGNPDAMDVDGQALSISMLNDGINDNSRLNKLDGSVTYENFLAGTLSSRSLLFNNFFSRFLRTTASLDFSRPVYHRYETSIAIQMLNIGKILTLAPEFAGNDILRDTLTCIEIFMPKVPVNKYWQEKPARRHCLKYISAIMNSEVTSLPVQWSEYIDNLFKSEQDRDRSPLVDKMVGQLRKFKITTRKELMDAGLDKDYKDLPTNDSENADVRAQIEINNRHLDDIIDMKFQILIDFIDHAILKFKSTFIKLWTVMISRSFLMICSLKLCLF